MSDIIGMLISVAVFAVGALYPFYLYENLSMVEQRLLTENKRYEISLTTTGIIMLGALISSVMALYYFQIKENHPTLLTVSLIIILVIYGIVMFLDQREKNQEIILIPRSDETNLANYQLRSRLDNDYLTVENPETGGIVSISFSSIANYELIKEPKKGPKISVNLRELKELLDDDVITQEDFDKAKKKILGI